MLAQWQLLTQRWRRADAKGERVRPWAMERPERPRRQATLVEYTRGIADCKERRQWQKASSLLNQLKIQGLQADGITHNALISAGQWQQAVQSLLQLQEIRLRAEVISYGAAVNACAEASKWHQALALLWELEKEVVSPNIIVCNSVISACARASQSQMAFEVMGGLAERNLEYNLLTFTIAITVYEKMSMWPKGLSLLASMKDQGLEGNPISYTATTKSSWEWQRSQELLSDAQKTSRADGILYSACIGACAQTTHWQQALGTLDILAIHGLQPDVALNAASSAGQKANLWTSTLAMLTERWQADVISFNSAIISCTAQWQLAHHLLAGMQAQSLKPDLIGYNSGISSCAAEWQRALQLFRGLQRGPWNLRVNAVTFGASTSVLESTSQWLWALELLQQATSCGKANAITYSAAIGACETAHLWQQALLLLQQLEAGRVEGRLLGYSGAIGACGRAGRWEQALLLLQSCGQPSIVTVGAAAKACERSAKWQQALELLQHIESHQLSCTVIMMNSVISSCEKASEWRQALHLLRSFAAKSLQADIISYNAAISACEFSAPLALSLALLDEARLQRLANVITFSATISACEKASAWQSASCWCFRSFCFKFHPPKKSWMMFPKDTQHNYLHPSIHHDSSPKLDGTTCSSCLAPHSMGSGS